MYILYLDLVMWSGPEGLCCMSGLSHGQLNYGLVWEKSQWNVTCVWILFLLPPPQIKTEFQQQQIFRLEVEDLNEHV